MTTFDKIFKIQPLVPLSEIIGLIENVEISGILETLRWRHDYDFQFTDIGFFSNDPKCIYARLFGFEKEESEDRYAWCPYDDENQEFLYKVSDGVTTLLQFDKFKDKNWVVLIRFQDLWSKFPESYSESYLIENVKKALIELQSESRPGR